jgi:hypothetical protein
MKTAIRVLISALAAAISYIFLAFVLLLLNVTGTRWWLPPTLILVTVVTWLVWRHSRSWSQTLMTGSIVALPVIAVVGWGYWRVSSYGYVYVSLNDVALSTSFLASQPVRSADLVFKDAAGRVLANARAEDRIVWLIHPRLGDCRGEAAKGQAAWHACFEETSSWVMTWVRDIRDASVRVDTCVIDRVPVAREEYKGSWWLWWVPLPHMDNSARTNFTLRLEINSAACRPAVP